MNSGLENYLKDNFNDNGVKLIAGNNDRES